MAFSYNRKRHLRRIISEQLMTGKSRQEVYIELSNEFKDRNAVAQLLSSIPSLKARKKYGFLNFSLVAIQVIFILLLFFEQIFIGAFICLLLIVPPVTYKVNWYPVIFIQGVLGVLFIGYIIYSENIFLAPNSKSDIGMIAGFCISILIMVLSLYLILKLCPEPRLEKQIVHEEGESNKTRIFHYFND